MLDISFTPFPVLITERLLLREIKEADAEQVFLLRSDKTSMQFLDKPLMQSAGEAALLIKKINADTSTNDGITWAIALKEDPSVLIGTIGLWRIMKDHYRAEIGYMLLPGYFNKGYMKEAIKEVIKFSFHQANLHSIEAHINPANAASAAVLTSTGFIREAYFRENFYFNGVFKDTAIYSLLKE
jgi:ribosomal-protein-alanine N-acetyltransferase